MTGASFQTQVRESITVLEALLEQTYTVEQMIEVVCNALQAGHSLFTCGNGGSAADALHLSQELVGRYRSNRVPLASVCLNADVTAMTCIANDFGYDQVFARPLQALARSGDILVCFSTSGQSPNMLAALEMARTQGVISIALLGKDGGAALSLANYALVVPSNSTARIQEVHTLILHAMCEAVEQVFPADTTG
ncbi:MAG: SIS domain-containing protein [Chloroflexaceae bacterium]|nr:SIS domain-containing protein [Chloroflexaceae bacterium]